MIGGQINYLKYEINLNTDLHKAATKDLDTKVRKMVTELRDTRLIAKVFSGDLTALDAVYHKNCLTSLHTKYRSFCRQKDTFDSVLGAESIAFAELISYIEEVHKMEKDSNYIMKLTALVTLFTNRLQQLQGNTPTTTRVNSTRLQEKLLMSIPELQANKSTHGIVLSFKDTTGDALLSASQRDSDSDAVVLMRAAQIIRRDMFHSFNGYFLDDNLDSIPATMLALIQMILGGTSIKTQTENSEDVSSAVISLAQLMIFNSVKRARKGSHSMRHSSDRETLLPQYIVCHKHLNKLKMTTWMKLSDSLLSSISQLSKVNEARKQWVVYDNSQLENIPPTRDALYLHVQRAAYQAGHIWGQAHIAAPTLPYPSDWGWKKTAGDQWSPKWTSLPEASKCVRELVKCNCKKNCHRLCKCLKASLKCTQLCYCGGQCIQSE